MSDTASAGSIGSTPSEHTAGSTLNGASSAMITRRRNAGNRPQAAPQTQVAEEKQSWVIWPLVGCSSFALILVFYLVFASGAQHTQHAAPGRKTLRGDDKIPKGELQDLATYRAGGIAGGLKGVKDLVAEARRKKELQEGGFDADRGAVFGERDRVRAFQERADGKGGGEDMGALGAVGERLRAAEDLPKLNPYDAGNVDAYRQELERKRHARREERLAAREAMRGEWEQRLNEHLSHGRDREGDEELGGGRGGGGPGGPGGGVPDPRDMFGDRDPFGDRDAYKDRMRGRERGKDPRARLEALRAMRDRAGDFGGSDRMDRLREIAGDIPGFAERMGRLKRPRFDDDNEDGFGQREGAGDDDDDFLGGRLADKYRKKMRDKMMAGGGNHPDFPDMMDRMDRRRYDFKDRDRFRDRMAGGDRDRDRFARRADDAGSRGAGGRDWEEPGCHDRASLEICQKALEGGQCELLSHACAKTCGFCSGSDKPKPKEAEAFEIQGGNPPEEEEEED